MYLFLISLVSVISYRIIQSSFKLTKEMQKNAFLLSQISYWMLVVYSIFILVHLKLSKVLNLIAFAIQRFLNGKGNHKHINSVLVRTSCKILWSCLQILIIEKASTNTYLDCSKKNKSLYILRSHINLIGYLYFTVHVIFVMM